jgi:hypothetical protein
MKKSREEHLNRHLILVLWKSDNFYFAFEQAARLGAVEGELIGRWLA